VFPSGRAAIAQILAGLDLPANGAIAVAGHGSECLTRVVRRYGAPLDMCDPAADAQAAVVYEPWGWPLTDGAWQQLAQRFKGGMFIVDRVDSADFFASGQVRALPPESVEVLSLSKLLGIEGGGLARSRAGLVRFEPQPESAAMRSLRGRPLATLTRGGYREVFKESRQAAHPAVLNWLQQNCLISAAEHERSARQRHLLSLVDSGLATGWPAWMRDAVGAGAGPVWAPILRGSDAVRRWSAMKTLDQRYGVVSALRLFNWSGNPLRSEYAECLALPVHGGVTEFGELIAALE
jgi:hypothetical protein